MARKFEVEVTRTVVVEVNESKFTEEFMENYRGYIDSSFYDLEDHIKQLGWLFGAGRINGSEKEFIEGYGPANEMGIKFKEIGYDDINITREIK